MQDIFNGSMEKRTDVFCQLNMKNRNSFDDK